MGFPNAQNNPAGAIPVYIVGGGSLPPPGTVSKGEETIDDLSSAVALTVPDGATYAVVQAEAQDVRWTDSGTPPTGSTGTLIAAGASQTFVGADELAALQFIEVTSGAQLNVNYYGPA